MEIHRVKADLTRIDEIRKKVKVQKPLIHCITNPISINDCANLVLAVGAKPIMAEHPKEVAGITAMAGALAVNLGNITDARMESILISGKVAKDRKIPSVIDVVGVTCSKIRQELASQYIKECSPAVIKGNVSEIRVLAGYHSDAAGIDVSDKETFTETDSETAIQTAKMVRNLAEQTHSVVVASGIVDTISDGIQVIQVENGCEMLSQITGTGCMLNVLIASFLAVSDAWNAACLGTGMIGVGGELADQSRGCGTFHMSLLDCMNTMESKALVEHIKYRKIDKVY